MSNVDFSIVKIISKSSKTITTEFLEKNQNILEIEIQYDENNTILFENAKKFKTHYTREEFLDIREEIEKIKNKIILPDEEDENYEKKIFFQIYKILGEKIYYNFDVLKDENKGNSKMQDLCRNLYGGLINNSSVCLGFSVVLQALLEEFDIETKCVVCSTHAWNKVKLNGIEYYCDLTGDAPYIQAGDAGKYPLPFCLTNSKFFGHEEYTFTKIENGIDFEEQLQLFKWCERENEENIDISLDDETMPREDEKEESIREMRGMVVSFSGSIKESDFGGLDYAFKDENVQEVENNKLKDSRF